MRERNSAGKSFQSRRMLLITEGAVCRIRPRRESESLMDASWQDVLVFDGQQEGKEERARHAAAVAAAAINGKTYSNKECGVR